MAFPKTDSVNMIDTHPVLVFLNLAPIYPQKPLLSVIDNPTLPFISKKESVDQWQRELHSVYLPLLQFFIEQNIHINIVITGHFLDMSAQYCPDIIKLLSQGVKKRILCITTDAYWGNSHLSMYYFDWWIDEILGTQERLAYYLISSDSIFIPMIYRQLPLEKLKDKTGITKYVSLSSEPRGNLVTALLREFRKFQGKKVAWLQNDKSEISLLWYGYLQYFDLFDSKIHINTTQMIKTKQLEIGLRSTEMITGKKRSRSHKKVRIPEERGWSTSSHLEQATFRLWQYATYMIGKEHAEIDTIDDDPLMRNLYYSMNRDILSYLKSEYYKKVHILQFSSPYEAFIHIQNSVVQLEILLKLRV